MKSTHLFAATLAAALAVTQAVAGPAFIAGGILTGSQVVTFEDVTGGVDAGTNYDGILTSGGVSFAERFAGQVNVPVAGFDVLSGTPSSDLALAVGAVNQNLAVATPASSNVLGGLGTASHPSFDALGEGSIAILFSEDQSEFGLDIAFTDSGTATLDFFRRDGFLIEQVILNLPLSNNTSYAFARVGGLKDIAGVSIFNNDLQGFAIDNVRYDVPVGGNGQGQLPEPGSLVLSALALLGLAAVRRRNG